MGPRLELGPSREQRSPIGLAALLAAGTFLILVRAAAATAETEVEGEPYAPIAVPESRGAGIPPDEVLERNGALIGDILVRVEDVFDTELPEERHRLYRLANDLHIDTRHGVIRSQLLFASGEPYSARLLRETERLLRTRKYLYDCAIRPVSYRDNVVDLEVWVKDVWTLKPAVSLSRSGGTNDWGVEIEDLNLLGTGRRVAFEWEDTVDRTSLTAQFVDSTLLGSRFELDALYADNSDGEYLKLELTRPFFALDTRWAAGARVFSNDRIDTLYSLGEPVDRLFHRQEEIEIFAGRSRGLNGSRAHRWLAGVTYQRDRYADAESFAPAGELRDDLQLVYPWVGYESVGDAFTTARNQDQLGRTEDLLLGTRHRLRLGFASQSLGSDRDQIVFRGSTEYGVEVTREALLLGTAAAMGRWDHHGLEDFLALAEGRLYRRLFGKHLFFATLQLAAAEDLDGRQPPQVLRVVDDGAASLQLLLGGDSGLRGYPLRYQDGDARALLTLEQRFFTGFHPLRLAFVGAAVFLDVGRTWPGEESGPNLGWLADVGFGLRLSSSRSGFGTVVHFDVAFPLGGDDSIDTVQFLITSKRSL